jgi:NAD(P)-dependent dehydrogenase (short-subunit alcohol dehydrogenase family)
MKQFENKVAIVTGGASGIGKAICVYLASHGATVIIADCNLNGAKETESFITSNGGYGKTVYADVSNPKDVESLIISTVKEFGQIDFLFNNAGIGINGEFQDMNLEQWKRIMDVNFWGTIYGCYYVYPIMMKQGFGHIVNVSSLAGLMSGGLMTSYSASKHAVVGFSLTLRAEAKQYGIKVSALCPGFLETPIHKVTPNVSEFLNSEKNKKVNACMKYPTAEDCINQMMRGVRRNKAIIVSPKKHKMFWWMYRLFPGAIPMMWTMIIKHMKKNI